MIYQVQTDGADLLVLSVHNRVIMISRDMSEITTKMADHYANQREKDKDVAERANIITSSLEVEERTPSKQINHMLSEKSNKRPDDGSLGKLFSL